MDLPYAAVIFDPSLTDGIEGKLIVDTDLERLQAVVARTVDMLNADLDPEDNPGPFDWSELVYYPAGEVTYGAFAWGRIYEITYGQVLSFSEYEGH